MSTILWVQQLTWSLQPLQLPFQCCTRRCCCSCNGCWLGAIANLVTVCCFAAHCRLPLAYKIFKYFVAIAATYLHWGLMLCPRYRMKARGCWGSWRSSSGAPAYAINIVRQLLDCLNIYSIRKKYGVNAAYQPGGKDDGQTLSLSSAPQLSLDMLIRLWLRLLSLPMLLLCCFYSLRLSLSLAEKISLCQLLASKLLG